MVLLACERVGVRAPWAEMEDFVHLWRYIGWLMGVEDVLGEAGGSHDIASCKAQLESILVHLVRPDERVAKMVNNVLHCIVNRPPRNLSIERTVSLTRFFTTDRYADVLGVSALPDGGWHWWRHVLPYLLVCRAFCCVTSIPYLGAALCDRNCRLAGARLRKGVGCPVTFEFKQYQDR